MADQDNRLQFPPTKVDFVNTFGSNGQTHESVPAPGQARYDHIRSWLMGLLAHQSSEHSEAPTQARVGTTWYVNDLGIYYYTDDNGTTWKSLAEAIGLSIDSSAVDSSGVTTLSEWYAIAAPIIAAITPKFTWSGHSSSYGVTFIPAPDAFAVVINSLKTILSPIVYINGILVDPRNVRFTACCDGVELLNGITMSKNDTFTVFVEKIEYVESSEIIA